jgi:outer membrane protein TolC
MLLIGAPCSAQNGELQLTLRDAIKQAVEKNLDVQVELYNPAAADAVLRGSRGIYDPGLNLSSSYQHSTTIPPSSTIAGGVSVSKVSELQLDAGISRLVPTGARLGVAFNNSLNQNNSDINRGFLDYYWQSDLSFNLSQPLLKNFGREATELNITVAQYGKEGSLEHYKGRILETVQRVRTEYFNLYSLREDLSVKRTSLALAQKILAETKARVKAGVLPAMEILNAEFGVAAREKDLIDAERAVTDQNDLLRLLLQVEVKGEIVPADVPSKEPVAISEGEALERSLKLRPEILEQQAALRSLSIQEQVAGNRTKPDLNLTAGATFTGLASSYPRDVERLGSGRYPIWSVGLSFEYPLGNTAAENEYIRTRLKSEQGRAQLKSLEAGISNEVKSAVRGVSTSYKQLEVTDRGRAFAEERLKAFIKRNEVGLATTKDVLDVENDLVTAKSNQIKAQVNYANALTQFWKTTGELLELERISVTAATAEQLVDRGRNHSP